MGRAAATTTLLRLAPLSGIVAVLLGVAAFAVGGWSGYRPVGDEAIDVFMADPARIQLGALIGGFYSLFFLVVFIGCVAAAIHRHDQDARLAFIALAGGIVAVIALAVGYRFLNAAAFQADATGGIGPEMATVMFRLYASSFAGLLSFGLAALVGATGLSALRSGTLPRWLGSISVVCAVGLMTPAHALFEALALLWIVAVSLLLSRTMTRAARIT